MIINALPLMGLIGTLSIFVLLLVLGLLSRRLGSVTRTRPYYLGFFVAALLLALALLLQILVAQGEIELPNDADPQTTLAFIHAGLIALALTIALIPAWHYWRWLLAERS